MKRFNQNLTRLPFMTVLLCILLLVIISSCKKETMQNVATEPQAQEKKFVKNFKQVNLVGDNGEYSPARIDPNFINGWGIAISPNGFFWVSSEGAGTSVIYDKDGGEVRPPVSIPSPTSASGGHPAGQVFNATNDFVLSNGTKAFFIFAGLDGVISAWNPAAGNSAIPVINEPGDVYPGIAIAQDGGANFLYVAAFSEHKVEVYDANFNEVDKPFVDPDIPKDFAPFNIQNIGGKLYVMYAKIDDEKGEEVTGQGLGYVDIFNPDGSLEKRFISRGQLNAPWGIAWAPASFFGDGGQPAILVGNFGDGHINAYSEEGRFLGQLRAHGKPIKIDGLWGISFPPATATTINPNWLYFAAGPDDEEHGLFGYLTK
jgi:uncharacterized protein (TIGR03118 family)